MDRSNDYVYPLQLLQLMLAAFVAQKKKARNENLVCLT